MNDTKSISALIWNAADDELLSNIIKQVNERFGSTLSEDDKLDLGTLNMRINEDAELRDIMKGDSSDTNKREFFMKTIDRILLGYVNEKFEFYKKMEDPKVKSYVQRSLYESYKN